MLSVKNIFHAFSIFRFELASSQSHDMQMSRAGYGHDLMTDNDMEVGRRMVAIMLSGIFKPCCCRLFLWRSRRRSLNTWRSQSTCRTSFRLSSRRSTTLSWTKRWCRGGRGWPDARRERLKIENWNWKLKMKIFPGHRPWQATQSATDWGREQIFDNTEGEYKCKYKYRRWI